MPRGKHLWDAAGLVSLPLIALAFVYFNFLEEHVAQMLPASVSERWEGYPTVWIGKDQKPFVITPTVQLVFGLAAGGVATAVFQVARLLERRDLEQAVREQPTELLRHVPEAEEEQEDCDEPTPASSAPPAHVAPNPPPAAPPPAPPPETMVGRVEEILNSLKCRWRPLADDTWVAEIRRLQGYGIRLQVRVDREFLLLQVQAALIPEQAWDPNVLAGTLLDAHVGMQYGSFRTVQGPAGRLVALGQICDTRYLPTPLLREIARRLIEQYLDTVQKLYALDLIEDGAPDDEWGSLC